MAVFEQDVDDGVENGIGKDVSWVTVKSNGTEGGLFSCNCSYKFSFDHLRDCEEPYL